MKYILVLLVGLMSVNALTFELSPQSALTTNSTEGRHLCCNGTQIAIIIIVGIVLLMLLVGCLLYNCPGLRSKRFRSEYSQIF